MPPAKQKYIQRQIKDPFDATPLGIAANTIKGLPKAAFQVLGKPLINVAATPTQLLAKGLGQPDPFVNKAFMGTEVSAPTPKDKFMDTVDVGSNFIPGGKAVVGAKAALPMVAGFAAKAQKAFTTITKAVGLTAADAAVEAKAIQKLEANREGAIKNYITEFGKVSNTDLARRYFKDVGYIGKNSPAVQEPASALSKDVWKENLRMNKQPDAILYAGMSGAGKSSAVKSVLPHIEDDAAAVFDGNLSKLSSAEKRMEEARDAGKDIRIVYVWRDPVDAWVNGVVKRMKSNPEEAGRVVPLKEAVQNGLGSLETVREMLKKGLQFNDELYVVDNSLGPKKARLMNREKFEQLSYPEGLYDILFQKTKDLYAKGAITKEEFKALTQ